MEKVDARQNVVGRVADLYAPPFSGALSRDRTLAGLRIEGLSLLTTAMHAAGTPGSRMCPDPSTVDLTRCHRHSSS